MFSSKLKNTRATAFLGCLFLVLNLGSALYAQSKAPTSPIRHYYEHCAKGAAKQRATYYIAWVPGAAHTCNISKFPPASARAFALENCEKSMVPVRRALGIKDKCRIAVDRGRVVDKVYRRAWTLRAIPVRVVIFDAKTGKKQVSNGQFHYRVTRYRGLQATQVGFQIIASGVKICDGTYSGSMLSSRINYRSDCFGETFRGKARIARAIKSRGIYEFVPGVVRVKSGRSWMELTF